MSVSPGRKAGTRCQGRYVFPGGWVVDGAPGFPAVSDIAIHRPTDLTHFRENPLFQIVSQNLSVLWPHVRPITRSIQKKKSVSRWAPWLRYQCWYQPKRRTEMVSTAVKKDITNEAPSSKWNAYGSPQPHRTSPFSWCSKPLSPRAPDICRGDMNHLDSGMWWHLHVVTSRSHRNHTIYVICMYLYKHVILEYQPMVKALWYIQDVFLVPGDGHLDTQWWHDFCGMVTWRRAFLFKAQKPAMCFPPANSQLLSDTSRWFSQHLRMILRKQGSNSNFFDFVGMARKNNFSSERAQHESQKIVSRNTTRHGLRFFDLYIYISKIPGAFWLSSSCWCGHAHFYWSLHSHDFTFNLSNLTGWISYKAIQASHSNGNASKTPSEKFRFQNPRCFFLKIGKNHFQETNPPTMVLILVGWNSNALSGASPGSWRLFQRRICSSKAGRNPCNSSHNFKGWGMVETRSCGFCWYLDTATKGCIFMPGFVGICVHCICRKMMKNEWFQREVIFIPYRISTVVSWRKMRWTWEEFLKASSKASSLAPEPLFRQKKKRWENWLRPFGTWHQINKNVLGIIPKYPPLNLKRTGPLVPPSPKNPPQPFWWNQNDNL